MNKILIIEDNTEVRENIAEILSISNYEVSTAENGLIGVRKAEAELPHLIICDVMMPELDGFGVLRILSKKPETASIPFIFLTAKTEKEDVRKGMNLGADDYITKPFDDVELLDAIEVRLKKSERLKQQFDNSAKGISQFISEARSQEKLNQLTEELESRLFNKKETVYREGSNARHLFFVSRGKVKTFKTNEFGKEFITQVYHAGEFFGYQDILQSTQYNESAVALEESEICSMTREDFLDLLYKDHEISARFIKMLANNIVDKEKQLLDLAYNSVRRRVADNLYKLYKAVKGNDRAVITITREDLANMVGTAKETVIRTLSDFKDEKIIRLEGSHIFILQPDKLEDMPN